MVQKKHEFVFDIGDCIAKYRKYYPCCMVLTSPNNPTGNSLLPTDLQMILENVAPSTLVVVDEAYWGFDPWYNQRAFLSLSESHGNLLFLRSFSKLYALAGLRIAFGFGAVDAKKWVNYQNRYLGMSRVLEEVAIAALESQTYYMTLSREISRDRERLFANVNQLNNFHAFASNANFVFIQIRNQKQSELLKNAFLKEKIVIYKFVDDDHIRVSMGTSRYTEEFLKFLRAIDR